MQVTPQNTLEAFNFYYYLLPMAAVHHQQQQQTVNMLRFVAKRVDVMTLLNRTMIKLSKSCSIDLLHVTKADIYEVMSDLIVSEHKNLSIVCDFLNGVGHKIDENVNFKSGLLKHGDFTAIKMVHEHMARLDVIIRNVNKPTKQQSNDDLKLEYSKCFNFILAAKMHIITSIDKYIRSLSTATILELEFIIQFIKAVTKNNSRFKILTDPWKQINMLDALVADLTNGKPVLLSAIHEHAADHE